MYIGEKLHYTKFSAFFNGHGFLYKDTTIQNLVTTIVEVLRKIIGPLFI